MKVSKVERAMNMASNAEQTGRRNSIGGFLVDKIDHDVMRDWVQEHGGGFPFEGISADDPAENLAVAMHAHFQKTISEDDLCACDACDGEGPDTPSCVFCGFRGKTSEVVATPAEPAKPKAAKTKKAAAAGDAEPKDEGKTDMAIANVDEGTVIKKAGKAKDKAAGANLVKVEGGVATVKTLDRLVKEAIDLKLASTNDYVGFARKVLEIHDRGLFKLRLDDNGKSRYASWDAFVHHELDITPMHASSLVKIARDFSDEDITALGRSKLTHILQLPKESRAEVIEEAKAKKLSKREVEKKVREVRERTGYEPEDKRSRGMVKKHKAKKAANAAAAPKGAEKVTVAQIDVSKKKVKVYARPQSIRNLKLEECKRAKAIGDLPFFEIELTNEVSILCTVRKGADGLLTAEYETHRKIVGAE